MGTAARRTGAAGHAIDIGRRWQVLRGQTGAERCEKRVTALSRQIREEQKLHLRLQNVRGFMGTVNSRNIICSYDHLYFTQSTFFYSLGKIYYGDCMHARGREREKKDKWELYAYVGRRKMTNVVHTCMHM